VADVLFPQTEHMQLDGMPGSLKEVIDGLCLERSLTMAPVLIIFLHAGSPLP
jgi:hypothetical protein